MTEPIVELQGLGRRYGSSPPLDALRGVDLSVLAGEWLAVMGPSGSGKSTLLNILGFLDRPTSGSYRFDGIDVGDLSDRQRAGLRGRRVGFVFQSFHLLPHRTARENVMMAEVYAAHSRRGRRERAEAMLDKVRLSQRAGFLPTRLSGGERQRVAIARALLGAPTLLLCDEPTGNLDSAATTSLLDLFGELNRDGLTIVTITHETDVAERATRQVRITDGTLTEAA